MRYEAIRPGMTLKLKPERQEAYGLLNPVIRVLGTKDRKGYKVGFVFGEYAENGLTMRGYFKPTDFAEVL